MTATIQTTTAEAARRVLMNRTPAFLDTLESQLLPHARISIMAAARQDSRANCQQDEWPLVVLYYVMIEGWVSIRYTARRLSMTIDELDEGLMSMGFESLGI